MPKDYDQITAIHYAAYRPLLHAEILKHHFSGPVIFELGLDVGCGTGQSSLALSYYCKEVFGIDPSKQMLARAINAPKVTYQYMQSNKLNFNDELFDVITFAGSLYYAKSQSLLKEIVRVSKPEGQILVYDFEIMMDGVIDLFELENNIKRESEYDHQTNFTGLETSFIKLMGTSINEYDFKVTIEDLTHLLLSVKDNYTLFRQTFGANLYDKIKEKLYILLKSETTTLKARTYSTHYSVLK